jgi:thiol-disulfide isomerase/thioredoxin
MVLTSSTKRELGFSAPDFALRDFDGRLVALSNFADRRGLLVVFWCNHCPFVKHIKRAFADFAREYADKGLAIVAINANDARTHPEDGPERMKADAQEFGFTFDYLIDETQEIARAYDAACTPDFFLFDRHRRLAYHGQFDASRPRNGEPITGADLRAAADAVLAGRPVPPDQTPSIGCNIKWRQT